MIVPYNGDYWNLAQPDSKPLAKTAMQILEDHRAFQHSARERAEGMFGVDQMVEAYRKMLLDPLPR